MSTPDPKTVREPLCDRIGRIAEQLETSAADLRGLPGVSRLRAALPDAVAALRNVADQVLDQGVELNDLRTTNDALRQQATEAREAANSWQQATIDLYSGRGEAAPDEQQSADPMAAEQQQDGAALRNISELLSDENLDAHRISASVAAAIRELREQLAAATARAEKAEDEVERLRSLEDSYIVALDQMSIGDVQRLRERAEKAEALLAKLGEPAPEYGLQYGDADPQALRAQDEIAYYRGRRHSGLRVRDVYRAPWRVVADAAPEGLSGPVERSEVSGGHGEGSNVRAASGGRVDARTEGGRTSAQ